MQDRQLYEQIPGIATPWFVEQVELKLEEEAVDVHLAHRQDADWPCPECGRTCPIHDHHGPRSWRHLDTCQYRTQLHATVPRGTCPEHGVRLVRVPWAEPHSRFTLLFERLGLSWDQVHAIMERAVARGLARRKAVRIPRVGVDEKAFCRGHSYATLVTDLDRGRVLYVAQGRPQSSLDGFWGTLTKQQLNSIQAVALDMCEASAQSIRQHLPQAEAKMVYDKFHVAKHLGQAVDRVRRAENKALVARGDRRLVGSKYRWLRNPDNFRPPQWRRFRALRDSNRKTARAWALKEQAMSLWEYRRVAAARRHFAWWYRWATHSRLPPLVQAARMLKSHLANILTYLQHGVTNATSESLNSKIPWVKYTARGFRNFQHFVTAIYFHCGGLDLTSAAT